MRPKTKSFFENMFILLILVLIIFAVYYMFFSSNEKEQIVKNTPVIETIIEPKEEIKKEESIKNDEIILENQNTPKTEEEQILIQENTTPQLEKENEVQIQEEIIKKDEEPALKKVIKEEEKIDNIVEIPTKTEEINKPISLKSFFNSIENQINSKVKELDTTKFDNETYANIRITILKNGKYEQPTFVDGNREFYNLIESSILKVFPVNIDSSIENNFPRYFRMKVKL